MRVAKNFKRQFAVNAAWSSIGNGVSSLITFVVFALVVRTVDAEAIGVVAFAMVLIVLGRVFVDAGIPELVLRQKDFDQRYASVAFWLNLAVSALAVLIFVFALAPLMNRFFAAGSGIVLAVLSLSFFADSTRVVHEAKFRRDFKYKALAQRNIAGTLISGVVGVSAAYAGFGVWALVAQRLTGSVVTTIVTWLSSDWRPSMLWSTQDASHQVSHGAGLLGAGMLKVIIQRIPETMLGLLQGPISVAIYGVGIRTYEALYQLTVFPMFSSAMSSFVRLKDREALGKAFLSTTSFFGTFSFPLFFGTAVIAEQFVPLVFGPNWQVSSYVLLALAIGAPPTIVGVLFHPVLNTLGRTALIFRLNLGSTGAILLTCAVFAPLGPVAVAIALAVRAYLGFGVVLWLLRREVGVRSQALLRANAPALISSLVMLAVTYALQRLSPVGLSDLLEIVLLALVGAGAYMATMIFVFPGHTAQVLRDAGEMFPEIKDLVSRLSYSNWRS